MLNYKNLNIFAGSEVIDQNCKLTAALPYELRNYFKNNCDIYQVSTAPGKWNYKITFSALYNLSTFGKTEKLRREIYREGNKKLIFSKNFLTFLSNNQDKKVFRFLLKGMHFANVKKCNYITLRKGEKLTFHPKPKNQLFTESLDWKRDGRQEIKPMALLILLFGTSVKKFISNTDLEEATDAIKNYMSLPKIVIADSFEQIYELPTAGWSQSSCMSGKGYTQLYEENKDVFEPIIFKIGNEIVGRCLRVSANQFTYYDRIYYKNTEHYSAIIEAIKTEGKYNFKSTNSIGSTEFTNLEGQSRNMHITVTATLSTSWSLPYMDTLCYYDDEQCELTNYDNDIHEGYKLDSTCGDCTTLERGVYDEIDECYIDEEDAVQIEFGNQRYCTTHRDNCYYSEGNDGYCLR